MCALLAPAKINWYLRVLGKRKDGFHDIQSLMQCVSLYDSISFELSPSIEISNDSGIQQNEDIVYKAALLLKKISGMDKGARIIVKKSIPMAAGLGGGSSDAAYALTGLNEFWGLGLGRMELSEIALSLGSDVSFFLNGTAALAEGRGEKISTVEIINSSTLLLLKPSIGVSSGWAYSMVKEYSNSGHDAELFIHALNERDYAYLRKMLKNDLEAPVFEKYPEIAGLKTKLMENGAALSAMSGSGSTVFGIFESREKAETAEKIIDAHWSAVVETIT